MLVKTLNFEFEFEYREETWDQVVVYIDPDTGKAPPDLEEDVGFKRIEFYPALDFNGRFPSTGLFGVTYI